MRYEFLIFNFHRSLASIQLFTLLASSSCLFANSSGFAQELEEVLVTANRRAERLQEVGATVSAFTDDALTIRSINELVDIAPYTPGLNIASYQTETSFFVRGIGTPAIIAGNDNSVATYLDDVFLSRAAAIGPAFFDIQRVEVLRGPQGTLYGRNATGGAVKLVTQSPGDEWEYEVRASAGNYSATRLFAAAGGPLSQTVRARIAVLSDQRDGYARLLRPVNTTQSSDDVDDRDALSARLKFEFDLGDSAMLTVSADYFEQDDQSAVFYYASAGYADEIPGWYQTREGSVTAPYFAAKDQARQTAPGSRRIFSDVDYGLETEVWGLTGRLDWLIGAYDLTAVASTRSTEPFLQNEFDLSDAFINVYQRGEDHEQNSLDVQLSSEEGQRFRWVAGGYYFDEENIITNNIFGDFWEPILIQGLLDLQSAGVIPSFPVDIPASPFCCDLRLNGTQESEAWAVYFDAQYDLTEKLTLSFGARQSEEERDGRQDFELLVLAPGTEGIRFAPNTALFPNAVSDSREGVQPDPFGFVVAPVVGPETFSDFTPKFAVDYQANDELLLYASAQKGFKSGGYNIGSSQRTPFKQESIWGYEAGLKYVAPDGSLSLNTALFHYDYENLQAQDSVENQPIIRNVGEAKVDGVEVEGLWRPRDGFQLDFAVAYLDARFTEGVLSEPLRPAPLDQPPGTLLQDLDGNRLPRAPEWKASLGAQVGWSLSNYGRVLLRANYSWQSEIFFTVFNIESGSQDSYGLADARIQFEHQSGSWDLSLYGRNLVDETYFSNQILTGTFYGAEFVGSLGAPRTYGLEFAYRM
ncbi:MAG: TonB-dependent receptor [Pseudomonadota bacterium]